MTRRGVVSALLIAAAAATFAASVPAAGQPAGAGSLDGCLRLDRTTRKVHVRAASERLTAAVLGRGRTGVVLANQSDQSLCGWLPFARTLAPQGFRVLLFDYGAGDPVQEVAAVARKLKRLGARRVVLAGASEGAKAAILAEAARPELSVAVVALSPERYLRGADVVSAARRLRVPTLFAVSKDDSYSAEDTPTIAHAAPSSHTRLVVVPGDSHGVDLLRGPPAGTVAAALYDFLVPLGPRRHPPTLTSECGAAVVAGSGAQAIAFTAGDGVQLHGDVLGQGDTTVVLAHEYPSTLCGWFPYASQLARDGSRVLLFDQRGNGARLDLDVVAAVEKARELGAKRVVAMGASLGGAATIFAAGRDCFYVSGLVSASGETDLRTYGRGVPPLYAVPFERRIRAPLLVVGSKGDPLIGEATVDRLLARVSAPTKHAVLVDGTDHGWDLLQGDHASSAIRDAVSDFIHQAGAPVATGCR